MSMMAGTVAPVVDAPPLVRHAPPELVVASSPAAGAEFSQAVDGYWWRLLTVFVRIVTDANAANRTVLIEYRDQAGNVYHRNGNPVTYPASSTEDFSFSCFHPRGEWEVSATNLVPLAPLMLPPTHVFAVTVTNIQATDALTRVRYVVEKFKIPSSSDYSTY